MLYTTKWFLQCYLDAVNSHLIIICEAYFWNNCLIDSLLRFKIFD